MRHSKGYLRLKRDVESEGSNWPDGGGPVPVFLACINATIFGITGNDPVELLGFRELALLGSWLTRASNLSTAELEELCLALTEAV